MFYFLSPTIMYNWILVVAAVIPAIVLLILVYKSDRIEKESGHLLRSLVVMGILATMIALIEERIGEAVLSFFLNEDTIIYQAILYFIIVAFAEETSKYILLKKKTWKNAEFNCQYDGVVYAVFVSLGFALWENISYVLTYGFSTAIIRALTAIPGHACFGVFMGIFYGLARKYLNRGKVFESKLLRIFSVLLPAFLHGAYDFIATMNSLLGTLLFIAFAFVLFAVSFGVILVSSKTDKYI